MEKIFDLTELDVSIRVVGEPDAPMFVASDLAKALDYRDAYNLCRILDDDEKGTHKVRTLGGDQDLTVITEMGMWHAIQLSRRPEAKQVRNWINGTVMPAIRKTGSFAVQKSMTPAEMFMQNAALMLEIERKQAEHSQQLQIINEKIDAAGTVMTSRPANSEPITHIRQRIHQKYGLPVWVIDEVLRQSPYAPKPAGTVRNEHAEAEGATYAVYWVKDINAVFSRFVRECFQETATKATHPFISQRFTLLNGGI
jgi:prophage antirepressor-like protein